MEKKRALVSTIYIVIFALLWMNLAPKLFPQFFPQPKPQPPQAQQVADADADAGGEEEQPPQEAANDADQAANAQPAPAPAELEKHPHRLIELGSLDPTSGYFMQVTVNTAGASIESVQLNDPRYRSISNRQAPLKIVGDDPHVQMRTLQSSIAAIDTQLKKFDTSLSEVDWEILKEEEGEVTLGYVSPDGTFQVQKHYRLNQGDVENADENVLGYLIDFELSIENLTGKPREVAYTLLGPVGLPLEDRNNARTFVEIKAGTLDDPGDPEDISDISLSAAALVKETDKAARLNDPGRMTIWRAPIKYIGVDVQYFAALIVPRENQLQDPYFAQAEPVIAGREGQSGQWSDLTVRLTSQELQLPPQGRVEHAFQVFFGPKRSELMEPLGAGGVKGLGWFSIVAQGMLSLLHFFHTVLWLPYGLAIMLLTVVVRACLFPISRKIAQNQKRMKELQPKMEEIRNKYKDDKQKQAEAYREFMAKHGFNPLAGCLPMLLQLPIFLGLYRALYSSVDLRMAEFLWIDNLAAPDQLFELPFTVPIVGWTYFNVLPLVTVALFMVQQKMFMPPPTSEEQALQYKMMNYFTLFLGFMFYRVPAGLCVYFITSSLWGICERKLLEKMGATSRDPSAEGPAANQKRGGGNSEGPGGTEPVRPKPPGIFAKLMEAADQAREQSNAPKRKADPPRSEKRKKSRHRP